MAILFEETAAERYVTVAMRDELEARIVDGRITRSQAAEALDLVPEGIETLLRRPWTFEEAYRVSAVLGFDFAAALTSRN